MTNKIIRGFFVLSCFIMGGLWAWYTVDRYSLQAPGMGTLIPWVVLGGLVGAVIAVAVLLGLRFITQELFERISPVLMAITLAMIMGYAFGQYIVSWMPEQTDNTVEVFIVTSLVLIFGYVGISLGLTRASNWESLIRAVHRRQIDEVNPKIIDTSVLIDGRIADICDTGFVEGTMIIPRFVLKELQGIADSADVLRRMRGRRGLDIIKKLQGPDSKVKIKVVEDDPEDIPEVDGKLVRLTRDYRGKIMTNDLNLNKVAQIEGVEVLNINDLANALKPAVLPDEEMHVKIVKEGKEAYQGVGYLDDGTMVVVDGGKAHVGRDVSVVVTSVLQTSAGRMIFTRLQNVLS